MNLRMWGNRLLLRDVSVVADQWESGLYIPETLQDAQRYRQWEVVARGDGVQEPFLQPGLRVITSGRFAGEPYEVDGQRYRIIFEDHIIAALTGGDEYE